ncbi:hypothetical protein BS47DRAFT_997137 [Hydnum rufescens UP504]|uniref:Uncharacterized protein n=1 Tax=Hydnum rufescens UP504 TaxID=1448309 RepID=A0A9P6B8Y9_9AGAM|nr:hypothetical protein BS47DRAFT_997137 [Hydnum rufescens UP504]
MCVAGFSPNSISLLGVTSPIAPYSLSFPIPSIVSFHPHYHPSHFNVHDKREARAAGRARRNQPLQPPRGTFW